MLNANLLIDDSLENALSCIESSRPMTVLLFGEYDWNKRLSKTDEPKDWMSFDERLFYENGREWWKDEEYGLPERIFRVKDWQDVIEWIKTEGHKHRVHSKLN